MSDLSSSLPAEAPREIPAEAVEAVIEGIDHESIERHGLDRPAILAILRAAAPFLAGVETVHAKALHSRDDSNPRGPWCGTCTTHWPCRTWIALLPAAERLGHGPEDNKPLRHVGGNANAEDCQACFGTNLPYPFICPGEEQGDPKETDR